MAVAQVQKASNASGSAVNTLSATIAAGTSGNLLVAVFMWVFPSEADTITFTDGTNTWITLPNSGVLADATQIVIGYAKNISGSPTSITATISNSHVYKCALSVMEYSGASTTNPLLNNTGGPDATGTAVNTGHPIVGGASAVTVGGMVANGITTVTDAVGWTSDVAANTTSGDTFDVQEKIGIGSFNPTWTLGLSKDASSVAATFQATPPFIAPLPFSALQAVKRAAHF